MYSEHDMKEFFQNVIDQVATLSTQASKVEGLEQRVQELFNRLNELETENRRLNHELNQTKESLGRAIDEADNTRRDFDNERAVTQSLRETIVQGDQRVVTVEQSFRQEQESHKITTSERDDARRKANELEEHVSHVYNELAEVKNDRDTWRNLAVEHEKEVNDLKQKLDRVNSILNPLRVLSGDVQATG